MHCLVLFHILQLSWSYRWGHLMTGYLSGKSESILISTTSKIVKPTSRCCQIRILFLIDNIDHTFGHERNLPCLMNVFFWSLGEVDAPGRSSVTSWTRESILSLTIPRLHCHYWDCPDICYCVSAFFVVELVARDESEIWYDL